MWRVLSDRVQVGRRDVADRQHPVPADVRTIKIRRQRAAKARKVALTDPDEFVELMARLRRKAR